MADRRSFPPFGPLRAFDAFGRTRGIRRAAEWLQIDHAVVSRHLRALEKWAGVPLLDRAGGGLTEAGRIYHDRIANALDEIARATEALRAGDLPQLSVWCVPGFAFHWLVRRLGNFRTEFPDIDLLLRPTDARARFWSDGVDADIRYQLDGRPHEPQPGIRQAELARPPVFPVASPDFLRRAGPIRTVGDLLSQPLLAEEDSHEWQTWLARQGVAAPSMIPAARLWHAHLVLASAREGQGVALANPFLLEDDLRNGTLVRVGSPEAPFDGVAIGAYTLLIPENSWERPALVRLRSWLIHVAGAFQPGAGAHAARAS
ncbi:LysR family transcriptional regulator [Gluconacetobacter liquefaciens]|uniref:DNA-binding transcriptional LysR family regulator n=1 Tax=Gluconacetobacter liquefaciens TaxID=89584 RepID=A0A370FVA1_GLULI|nr:LysR substrate-binding domain-containing protein [Gluconacetobacter liquefaciens]MBB2187893.1 LysR family transcriptional regulator [Gluconacetobacter liquefaciens]RDI34223.1 DNA-binding transcriptional LysR family regulator [Gluconacetobacter liquefaciens]GBR01476.1 LysR family transcriptional regulator [Gluconacetobacter liquefaciens NRIC 0522]GEB38815.1 LysR family transcriptional regulator [Gluconacetobacter liquefaciens]